MNEAWMDMVNLLFEYSCELSDTCEMLKEGEKNGQESKELEQSKIEK